ncbi:hypothetical protein ARMSODRAFT_1006527 [Armillaria solidipes]|uniref:Uncharacterized protein n=1 Tax=Armillaria solidipes TaxID=1076256 RepID=A0A2H3B7N5_9AGAR|nr:hypothetical protein ARMSODRAFT_1006527 [Armillaria solidipes]
MLQVSLQCPSSAATTRLNAISLIWVFLGRKTWFGYEGGFGAEKNAEQMDGEIGEKGSDLSLSDNSPHTQISLRVPIVPTTTSIIEEQRPIPEFYDPEGSRRLGQRI